MATLTVPMEPQPPDDAYEVFSWFRPDDVPAENCAAEGCYFYTPRGLNYLGPAPHRPGDRIPLREEWAEHYLSVRTPGWPKRVVYKADYPRGLDDTHDFGLFQWQPAETLPDEFVRNWGTVVSCVPVKLEGVWCWVTETET